MGVLSGIFRIIIGAAFGFACFVALSPALAALLPATSTGSVGALVVIVAVAALTGLLAPSIRRAFGWGFLELGLCTLALPLSTMVLAGKTAGEIATATSGDERAATLVGAGIGGGILTGAAAIVGFFLGAIFLILALVLLLGGGRREVVYIQPAGYPPDRGHRANAAAAPDRHEQVVRTRSPGVPRGPAAAPDRSAFRVMRATNSARY